MNRTPGDANAGSRPAAKLSQADHLRASLQAAQGNASQNQVSAAADLVPFELPEFARGANEGEAAKQPQLNVIVELGRTRLPVREVERLQLGSVVTLDQSATDVVSVYVDGRLIARGEMVVVQGKICVRVTELVARRAAA